MRNGLDIGKNKKKKKVKDDNGYDKKIRYILLLLCLIIFPI